MSFKATLIILFILLISYALKMLALEPYPAVVLPSGAMRIKRDPATNTVSVKSTKIFGLRNDSAWVEINPKQFLAPIPVTNLEFLAGECFGIEPKKANRSLSDRIKISRLGKRFFKPSNKQRGLDSLNKKELVNWLNNKLKKQNLDTGKLKIVTLKNQVLISTGAITHTRIDNEKIIDLF